ncbi:MAG: hypothetical protein ACR2OW_13580 [Methyloligellaceae bacterium]
MRMLCQRCRFPKYNCICPSAYPLNGGSGKLAQSIGTRSRLGRSLNWLFVVLVLASLLSLSYSFNLLAAVGEIVGL